MEVEGPETQRGERCYAKAKGERSARARARKASASSQNEAGESDEAEDDAAGRREWDNRVPRWWRESCCEIWRARDCEESLSRNKEAHGQTWETAKAVAHGLAPHSAFSLLLPTLCFGFCLHAF